MSTLPAAPNPLPMVEADDGFTLRMPRKPESVIAEASLCANALVNAVRKNGWVQKFGGKEHIFFEGWALLGGMYRCTARVRETRLVQIGDVTGYEAVAECFHIPSGIVISTAESMCLNDEDNWSMRPSKGTMKPVPLFQLRSMAQTRAMAKALRAPFSWIVAMAGYAPRAAEEMTGEERPDFESPRPPATPQRQANGEAAGNGAQKISAKQASRIWGLAHTANVDKDTVLRILKHFGFDQAADVTTDKYEQICAEVQKGDAAA